MNHRHEPLVACQQLLGNPPPKNSALSNTCIIIPSKKLKVTEKAIANRFLIFGLHQILTLHIIIILKEQELEPLNRDSSFKDSQKCLLMRLLKVELDCQTFYYPRYKDSILQLLAIICGLR